MADLVYDTVTACPAVTGDASVIVTVPGSVAVPEVLAIDDGVTVAPATITVKSANVAVPDAIAVFIVITRSEGAAFATVAESMYK